VACDQVLLVAYPNLGTCREPTVYGAKGRNYGEANCVLATLELFNVSDFGRESALELR